VSDLVQVGRVGKSHGLDGSFAVEDASKEPERFAVGATLLVGGERAQVMESKRSRGRPVIRLDREVERGAVIEIPKSELEEPGEGEYYAFQLVGLAVQDEDGAALGRVREVQPGVANDVLELDSGITLPLVDACVLDIDLDTGRILVARGFWAPR
jgi:16S rRNA processing protein RimM